MKMISCYIIDDQFPNLILLEKYIGETEGVYLAGKESDSIKAMNQLLEGEITADITFVDIDMPGISGLELASLINHLTSIVFITAHRQYGPEAFNLNAVDYLLKPISYTRFTEAVAKASDLQSHRTRPIAPRDSFFINGTGKGSWIRVAFADVLYIKGESNYVNYVLKGNSYLSYSSMEKAERNVLQHNFIRIHKSYIVNMNHITKIDGATVTLSNGESLPIGRSYKDAVMKRLMGG
ncbi:Transcriptional regulatory protein YehT [compost metagenome]